MGLANKLPAADHQKNVMHHGYLAHKQFFIERVAGRQAHQGAHGLVQQRGQLSGGDGSKNIVVAQTAAGAQVVAGGQDAIQAMGSTRVGIAKKPPDSVSYFAGIARR